MKTSKINTRHLVAASLLTAISIILTRMFSLIIPIAGVQALRIGFGGIPVMISGILFGPIIGALTGTVADLIGFMLNPMGGPYFPGFTLSAALSGFIPGLFYHYIFKKDSKLNFNIINGIMVVLLSSISAIIYLQAGNNISFEFFIVYMIGILGFILIPFRLNKKYKKNNDGYRFDKLIFTISITTIITSLILNTLWLIIMYKLGFIVIFPFRVLTALVTIPMETVLIFIFSKYFKYTK
ncbi:folate family ECF transporter S component [Clostridium sp. D2Q-11]|uniref:Folate family ECF transporter S component n=1 Tax=Anaeromonas frigoriresistens TaxID=2683708 RepID=A0A942V2V5_9FIRM|nr:folate family ECF transporter S component [Anaeromonas frigoriresistens]MBS4540117.1 folate family ECF transporter S component [Anaeromonas frigoriresistens]